MPAASLAQEKSNEAYLMLPYYGQIDLESDNAGKVFHVFLEVGGYALTTYIDERENSMAATVATFTNGDPLPGEPIGGLRLAQSTSYPVDGLPLIRRYYYTDRQGFSSGVMFAPPQYTQREYTDIVAEAPDNYLREIHSTIYNSAIGQFYGIGIPHYYASVLQEQSEGTQKLRSRHDYVSFQTIANFLGIQPLATTVYRQTGETVWMPLSMTSHGYYEKTDTLINAIRPYLRSQVIEAGGLYPPPGRTYDYEHYSVWKQWVVPAWKRTVEYSGADSLVELTTYHYDSNGYRNLQFVRHTDSRGVQRVTRYKYPQEYSSTLAAPFLSAHVLAPAWEEQVWLKSAPTDSVLISGRVTQFGSQFLPEAIHAVDSPVPLTSLNNQNVSAGKFTTLLSDTRYTQRVGFDYDPEGRLLSQWQPQGPETAYIWDYDGMYVVASVQGAGQSDIAYADFEAAGKGNWSYTGITVADATAPSGLRAYDLAGGNLSRTGLTPSVTYVLTYWAKSASAGNISGGAATAIRTRGSWTLYRRTLQGVSSVSLSGTVRIDGVRLHPLGADMETFAYHPLVGMTSRTDASGQTVYYEYDGFGRLKAVRDPDGNLVEEYRYHIPVH